MCCLPLCTAMVRPTKSGVIVERRDQVLIGRLSEVARAASTFDCRWWSTNGPFLIERGILVLSLLYRMPAADDHGIGSLVLARLITLARRAPWRHRMVPAATTVGAAPHRVIDRIHRDSAHGRSDAAPADRAGLADRPQVVFFVADAANGRAAIEVNAAYLAGVHTQLRVGTFTREKLYRRAGGARDLRALPRKHFDAMNGRAHGNVAQRQAVTRLDRSLGPAHELRPGRHSTRGDDVAPLAVRVQQQREVRAAVRIVFQALHLGSNAVLAALEVDDAIVVLVPAALMTRRDMAAVVAPRPARLALGEPLDRASLEE